MDKKALFGTKKFQMTKRCFCDAYGLPCTGDGPVNFEKTREGWKVTIDGRTELAPIDDKEAKRLMRSCPKKAVVVGGFVYRQVSGVK